MSAPAADDRALVRLLLRLERPGMIDVGRIGRDYHRLEAPGLGLGASPVTRRLSARGGARASSVATGEMVHAAPTAMATEDLANTSPTAAFKPDSASTAPSIVQSPASIEATGRSDAAPSPTLGATAPPNSPSSPDPIAVQAVLAGALARVADAGATTASHPARPAVTAGSATIALARTAPLPPEATPPSWVEVPISVRWACATWSSASTARLKRAAIRDRRVQQFSLF